MHRVYSLGFCLIGFIYISVISWLKKFGVNSEWLCIGRSFSLALAWWHGSAVVIVRAIRRCDFFVKAGEMGLKCPVRLVVWRRLALFGIVVLDFLGLSSVI